MVLGWEELLTDSLLVGDKIQPGESVVFCGTDILLL